MKACHSDAIVDTGPFISAFQELNTSFIKLLDSMSALRALSSLPRLSGLSDRQLLENALQVLVQNQDLECCSVYLLEGGRLHNVAGVDWDDLIRVERSSDVRHTGRSFALGEGILGKAAQTGELEHCRDCTTDPRFLQENRPGTAPPRLGSLISIPIQLDGDILGVLNVSHPHPGFFNEAHERALTIFASFLGQMLVNNRLLGQMEKQVTARTRQLEKALAEAEELKQKYAQLSVVDELTSLHNRRFFFPEARAALSRALRHGSPYSVLLLDIDHFKQINDTLGHAGGDEVLCRIAALLEEKTREGDILARFGGEEFIAALPDTDLAGALRMAERIRAGMGQARIELVGHSVTLSIGASSLLPGESGDSDKILDRLIQEADQALYFGKHNGRDQCRSFAEIACQVSGKK